VIFVVSFVITTSIGLLYGLSCWGGCRLDGGLIWYGFTIITSGRLRWTTNHRLIAVGNRWIRLAVYSKYLITVLRAGSAAGRGGVVVGWLAMGLNGSVELILIFYHYFDLTTHSMIK
jgi:hypothetical protein